MKRIALVFAITSSLLFGSLAFAAVKTGSTCSKAGSTSTVLGKKYTCIKSGKKLVWDKGVVVKKPIVVAPKVEENPNNNSKETNSQAIDLNKLPLTLTNPKFVSEVTTSKNFIISFEVDPKADGGYIEVKELNLDYSNTYKSKDQNNIVVITASIPESYREHSLKIMFYSISKTAKSGCCSGVDVELTRDNTTSMNKNYGPDINNYQAPTKILKSPTTIISPSTNFANLTPCKLKDGDPVLDNMTVGFPIPGGRTDLTQAVKVEVLAADFADVSSASNPAIDYGNAIKTMKHFWESQASTGLKINVNIAQSYKRMPKTVAEYELGQSLNGFKGDNYWVFIQSVINAYDAEIDFSGVSTIAVVVPLAVSAAQIGTWVVYTQGVFKTNEGSVYNVMITGNGDSKAAPASWVHEYGHTLGLTDMRYVNSAMPTEQKPEGLGIYDVMGSGNTAPDVLVWSRFLTNMLLPDQIHCVTTNETSTHWLIPIEQQTPQVKGIVIPLSEYTAIVVESRRNYGYDNLDRYGEGALIYTIDTRLPYHRSPAFIQAPTRSKDLDWYSDAALQLGESVSTNGWKITVIETGDFGDVVKVEKVS